MKLINFNDAWYNLDKLLYITDIFLYTFDGMDTVIKEHYALDGYCIVV